MSNITTNGHSATITAHGGSDALLEAALWFAAERVQAATRVVAAAGLPRPTSTALSRKFAARQLRQAQSQIKAALALLEMDL